MREIWVLSAPPGRCRRDPGGYRWARQQRWRRTNAVAGRREWKPEVADNGRGSPRHRQGVRPGSSGALPRHLRRQQRRSLAPSSMSVLTTRVRPIQPTLHRVSINPVSRLCCATVVVQPLHLLAAQTCTEIHVLSIPGPSVCSQSIFTLAVVSGDCLLLSSR